MMELTGNKGTQIEKLLDQLEMVTLKTTEADVKDMKNQWAGRQESPRFTPKTEEDDPSSVYSAMVSNYPSEGGETLA